MANVNIKFDLLNEETVKTLAQDSPNLLPKYDFRDAKDFAWNQRQLASVLQDGVLSGSSTQTISRDLSRVTDMNMSTATRITRTAMTSASNQGRMDSYSNALSLGIKGKIMWLATIDERTRDTHAVLDGEKINPGEEFSNGLKFPGDPTGEPSEVYNCRCTTTFEVDGMDEMMLNERNMTYWDGTSRIGDKTYEEWKQEHWDNLYTKVMPSFPSFATLLTEEGKAILKQRELEREVANAEADVTKAKSNLTKAEQKRDVFKAELEASDKSYSDIWRVDKSLSQYKTLESQGEIERKVRYYEGKIAAGIDIEKYTAKLATVREFEELGKQYEKGVAKLKRLERKVTNEQKKLNEANAKLAIQNSKLKAFLNPGYVEYEVIDFREYDKLQKEMFRDKFTDIRQLGKTQISSLTKAQKDAVVEYSTSSYRPMNKYKRFGVDPGDRLLKSCANLDAAFEVEAIAIPEDMFLYRETSNTAMRTLIDTFGEAEILANPEIVKGFPYVDKAYFSSTIKPGGTYSSGHGTVFHIHAPKGTKAMYIDSVSANSGELEMLFKAGQMFYTDHVEMVGGTWHIYARAMLDGEV